MIVLQLLKSKTGVRRSDDIVNRLVMLVLETGAMTGKQDLRPAYLGRCLTIYLTAVVALLYSIFAMADTVRSTKHSGYLSDAERWVNRPERPTFRNPVSVAHTYFSPSSTGVLVSISDILKTLT